MRLLLCLLPLAAVAAAPVNKPVANQPAKCPMAHVTPAEQKARQPLVHPLTDEPGARQEIAVQRTDADGCVKPIVVRDNVGDTAPPLPDDHAAPATTITPARR